MEFPLLNSLWVHTKTKNTYVVLHIARMESSMELMVIYARWDNGIVEGMSPWVRTLSEWMGYNSYGVRRFLPIEEVRPKTRG